MTPIIVIPARLAASRLPGKPLSQILGKPMIVRVLEQSQKANIGPVIIACCSVEVQKVVEYAGGIAILTDPDHPSGTDRIYEALTKFDPQKKFDVVINVQGDLPVIDPKIIQDIMPTFKETTTEMVTLVTPIINQEEAEDPNIVKCVFSPQGKDYGQALYFSRSAIPHKGPYYHHIGLYGYTRSALEQLVNLPPTYLEKIEKLEQMRALENNMKIGLKIVNTMPLGVDTPENIKEVEAFIQRNRG